MKISNILEVLIAMAIIYFLFSTLVSIIFEWYTYKTQKRGRFLYETILKLLNDTVNQSYGAFLYLHYSIDKLKKNKDSYPQYISSSMFADALIDVIGTQSEIIEFKRNFANDGSKNLDSVELIETRIQDPFARFKVGVDKMHYSPLKSQLRSFYEKSKDYPELKALIMGWFDDYMARVSGWYALKTKRALFYISLLVSLLFNLDSIRLVKKLNQDDELRKSLIIQAEQKVFNANIESTRLDSNRTFNSNAEFIEFIKQSQFFKDSLNQAYFERCDSIVNVIENNSLPVGYHGDIEKTHGSWYFLIWLFGILISAYALSFGAPFWFDVMVKAINIRRAGVKPEKSN